MAKLAVTYEMEVDAGNIPAEALAEWLLTAEKSSSEFNIFEIGVGSGTIEIVDVKVAA